MKIGITGSHSTGKSTLARRLSKELDCPMLTEVARRACREAGYDLNKSTTLECQLWILENQIKEEIALYPGGTFVSDRTTLDQIPYTILSNNIEDTELGYEPYIRSCYEWGKSYDIIVYCPIEFPLERDDIRSDDELYWREVDEILYLILYTRLLPLHKEDRPKVITVRGSTEKRGKKVLYEMECMKDE